MPHSDKGYDTHAYGDTYKNPLYEFITGNTNYWYGVFHGYAG